MKRATDAVLALRMVLVMAILLAALAPPAAGERGGRGPSFGTPDVVGAAAVWRVRDVAADSGFASSDASGVVPGLDLRLAPAVSAGPPAWRYSCTVEEMTGKDRAVTLALSIRFDATGWRWWDDPQRSRAVRGREPLANLTEGYYGLAHMGSRYPLAVLDNGSEAICLAAPIRPARAVRFLYDPVLLELRAEFDFGLSPIPVAFPSRADAAVLAYQVPAQWAFRRALERYYEIHADALRRQAGEGGTFLTKSPLEPIGNPQDFCFAWHDFAEGATHLAETDHRCGVQSFLYREPQTDWRMLRPAPEREPGYDEYLRQLREDAQAGSRESQASLVSAVVRADGRYDLYLEDIAWTSRAPFGLNAAPGVRSTAYPGWPSKAEFEFEAYRRLLGWNSTPTKLDGVFFDSMEGWGNLMNYRREHWRTTAYPLSFDPGNGNRVCLFNLWGNVAFAEALSQRLHERGQLLAGNDAFYHTWYHMPFVDIPGREVASAEDGVWEPGSDELYLFFRSMAARRPFWTLLNDNYDDSGKIERYFRRSLFYGIFPSMFHPHDGCSPWYWTTPKYYNRDRRLFKKYLPLIRRLDNAGWEPVPHAAADPETVRLERFGNAATGDLAFTLHNTAQREQKVRITLHLRDLQIAALPRVTEWLTARPVAAADAGPGCAQLELSLPGDGYAVIGVASVGGRGSGK